MPTGGRSSLRVSNTSRFCSALFDPLPTRSFVNLELQRAYAEIDLRTTSGGGAQTPPYPEDPAEKLDRMSTPVAAGDDDKPILIQPPMHEPTPNFQTADDRPIKRILH